MSTEPPEIRAADLLAGGNWRERLDSIVETMHQVSLQRDPQTIVRLYSEQVQRISPTDRLLSVTRRGLEPPQYRIARNSGWKKQPNPWRERERLPVLRGGLLGQLVYGEKPVLIDDLHVPADDPAAEYFAGMRSLVSIPVFDEGRAFNTVVLMRKRRAAFDREQFPLQVWLSNLFGRATHNLVLSEHLREAHAHLARQNAVVGEIQRTLLPRSLPAIARLDFSVHYEAAEKAGGDYYDFLPLDGDRWGILVADVSGHGTPAAVLMAITRVIVHMAAKNAETPRSMLRFLNHHLAAHYTSDTGMFVTAFYSIFDPETRRLDYSIAGHPPPRLKRCSGNAIEVVDGAAHPPLGIVADQDYADSSITLLPGDQIALFTDGITEARDPADAFFGFERLDRVLDDCGRDASGMLRGIVDALDEFTAGRAADDDRTLLVGRAS